MAYFFRFNLMAYFLTSAVLALAGGAVQLLRQSAGAFHTQGYVALGAVMVLFAWPLIAWLRLRGTDAPSAAIPAGTSGAGEPPAILP